MSRITGATDDLDEAAVYLRKMAQDMNAVLSMTCADASFDQAHALSVEWITRLRKMSCDLRARAAVYKPGWKVWYNKGDGATWCCEHLLGRQT